MMLVGDTPPSVVSGTSSESPAAEAGLVSPAAEAVEGALCGL